MSLAATVNSIAVSFSIQPMAPYVSLFLRPVLLSAGEDLEQE